MSGMTGRYVGPAATVNRMTTLSDRPNAALLVLDVQKGNTGEAYQRDRVIANINTLVAKARAEHVPVIWIQHFDDRMPRGSTAWEYADELARRRDDEPLVAKSWFDAFEDSDLEQRLAERRVGRIMVTGASTDACIRGTLHGAVVRGYDATLVGDAHTSEDMSQWGYPPPEQMISYTNLFWDEHTAPGRRGGTVETANVEFAAPV
jgi:nicotinamidase-related amidase